MTEAQEQTSSSISATRAVEPYCYLNGAIIPLADARVSIVDIGLLRGFGIYEGLITHNRKPFALADHLARFRRSAEALALTIPATDEEIETAMRSLVERNVPPEKEALIRIILTGGPTTGVIEYNPATPTMYMIVDTFEPIDQRLVEAGCSVMTASYKRELAEVKTTNYIQAVLLQKKRKDVGALEIIYTADGLVYEGAGSNIFIVSNGTLITPKEGVVFGITRKVVLDLAQGVVPIEERPVTIEELFAADEVCITGSFKEVVPVVRMDDRVVGTGRVGPVTKKLVELFRAYTASY